MLIKRQFQMAKYYRYLDSKTKKVLFETVQPNYVNQNDVHQLVANKTKIDPRINPGAFEIFVRSVPDNFKIPRKTTGYKKPYRKNKKYFKHKKPVKKLEKA